MPIVARIVGLIAGAAAFRWATATFLEPDIARRQRYKVDVIRELNHDLEQRIAECTAQLLKEAIQVTQGVL